jgi:hypothetical protein
MIGRQALLAAVMALTLGAGPGAAVECLEYRDYLHETGYVTRPDNRPRAVVIAGEFVYAVSQFSTLTVFSMVDPAHPALVADVPQAVGFNSVVDIARSGSRVYTADATGLGIFDVTVPEAPARLSGLAMPPGNRCERVAVAGTHVYAAFANQELQIVDATDPAHPVIVNTLDLDASVKALCVDGGRLCVVEASGRVRLFDVADPAQPALVGELTAFTAPTSAALAGSHLYVCDDLALWIWDVTDPALAQVTGHLTDLRRAEKLVVDGDLALATGAGLRLVDVSDRTLPMVHGTIAWETGALGVACSGERICLAESGGALRVYDRRNSRLAPVGAGVAFGANAVQLALGGPLAYVSAADNSLRVVDIADPLAPLEVGRVDLSFRVARLAVDDGHLFAAAGAAGLQVFTLADPAQPSWVGGAVLQYEARGVAVSGSRALVLDDATRVNVFDVSAPATPQWTGRVNLPYGDTVYSSVSSLAIHGRLAYVADGAAGIQVIDFSDAWNPRLVGQADVAFAAMDIRISGEQLYVTDLWYGLGIYDLDDPLQPSLISLTALPYSCSALAVTGDQAYVAGLTGGVTIFDAQDPVAPVRRGWFGDIRGTVGVAVAGGRVCVTGSGDINLQAGAAQCFAAAAAPQIAANVSLAVWPNPSSGTANFRFGAAHSGPVSLAIHDLRGRLLRELTAPGVASAVELAWDGRDADGHPAPAGTYLARVMSGAEAGRATRFALLR